jgi:cysteinyl-tRNA synthetase
LAGVAPDRPEGVASGPTGHREGADADTEAALHDHAATPVAPLSEGGRAYHRRFVDAIDDDLDMPAALTCARDVLRADMSADERRWLVLDADAVLGLDLHRVWSSDRGDGRPEIPAEIAAILDDRTAARAVKDYARSDALRDELATRGWDVIDAPGGSTIRRKDMP